MLTWILNVVALIAGFFSPNVWVFIILAGSILSGLCGTGWTTIIRYTITLIIYYYILSFVAWLLPGWLETIIVLAVIVAAIWTEL